MQEAHGIATRSGSLKTEITTNLTNNTNGKKETIWPIGTFPRERVYKEGRKNEMWLCCVLAFLNFGLSLLYSPNSKIHSGSLFPFVLLVRFVVLRSVVYRPPTSSFAWPILRRMSRTRSSSLWRTPWS